MSNKMIVYGCTGFGKSYTLISNILSTRRKVVVISDNGAEAELQYFNHEVLEDVDIKIVEPTELSKHEKVITPLFVRDVEREKVFLDLLSQLMTSGIANDESYTVIIMGFASCLNNESYIKTITDWKCSVVIEYSGSAVFVERSELPFIMSSDAWEKYPLYNSLRPGVPKVIPELSFVSGKDAKKYSKGLLRIFKADNLKIEQRRLYGEDGYYIKHSRSYVCMTADKQAKMYRQWEELIKKCPMLSCREL